MFIQAHEWICAFQADGFVLKLDDYDRRIPGVRSAPSTPRCGSRRSARTAASTPSRRTPRRACSSTTRSCCARPGFDDAFIEAMPQRTLDGDLTMDELIDIAKQVVDKTDAEYGILHRPNKGPDYMMVFQAYGNDFVDPETGNLLLERDKLAAGLRLVRARDQGRGHPRQQHRDGVRRAAQGVLHRQRRLLDVRHLGPRHLRLPDLRAAERRGGLLRRLGMDRRAACGEGRIGEQPDPSHRLRGRRRRGGPGARRPAARRSPRTPSSTPTTRSRRRISASSPSSSRTRATPKPGRWPGRPSCSRSPSSCPTTRNSAT